MGILDNLKKATGLGLDAQGAYDRAYEKGVLLGQEHYSDAANLFKKAAEKAEHENHAELANRAHANSALYSFVCRGGLEPLETLEGLLDRFQEIEQVGSKNDMMPTSPLLDEINARLVEADIDGLRSHTDLSEAHDQAAMAFKGIFNNDLITYRWQASDQHVDKASSRFFLHTGMAQWYRAVATIESEPQAATEHMAKALSGFKNAQDSAWAAKADKWLARGRHRRTCWVCHREFQGEGIHFHATSAAIAPYVVKRIEELGQDTSAIDYDRDQVVLCTPCHSVMHRMADAIASEKVEVLRDEMSDALAERDAALNALDSRLRQVESAAHKH